MSRSEILPWLEKHETLRSEGINLVVSENFLSLAARQALASDLAGRYSATWYGGGTFARRIEDATCELARSVFKAEYALIAPQSGNLCVLAALFAFTRAEDPVAMLPFTTGGYPLGLEKFQRRRLNLPAHPKTLEIDLPAACRLIREERPRLTFLGCSGIPFPHPVEEISRAVHDLGEGHTCVYDGSHVLGLIACGEFQDPLGEGADVLIGSTHKSLFGPQGGLILTRSAALAKALRRFLELDLEEGIGLVDNPHVNRIAALGLALEELRDRPDYGRAVVANSRALAQALDQGGLPVRFKDRGYSASHQVFLDLTPARAEAYCHDLESIGLFIDIGARVGTAEVTHLGMGASEMREIAEVMCDLYLQGPKESQKIRVKKIRGR